MTKSLYQQQIEISKKGNKTSGTIFAGKELMQLSLDRPLDGDGDGGGGGGGCSSPSPPPI